MGVRWGGAAFQFTHAKALVADRTRAWIGAMNWTPTSFSRNRDFAAVTDDAATVDAAETVVLSGWAAETVEGPLPALVVSPANARATLLGLINQHFVHQWTWYTSGRGQRGKRCHDQRPTERNTTPRRRIAIRAATTSWRAIRGDLNNVLTIHVVAYVTDRCDLLVHHPFHSAAVSDRRSKRRRWGQPGETRTTSARTFKALNDSERLQ